MENTTDRPRKKWHGLWQFHRALRESGRFLGSPRWWETDEEMDRARRNVAWVTKSFHGGAMVPVEYRVWSVIARCAFRAMRRWNLPKNAQTWNNLCEHIGARMNAHQLTMRAVVLEDARPKSPLKNLREFDRPYVRHRLGEIRRRLGRLVEFKKLRDMEREAYLARRCKFCKRQANRFEYVSSKTAKLLGLEETDLSRSLVRLCWQHGAEFQRLVDDASAIEEARSFVSTTKRKANEARQNPA